MYDPTWKKHEKDISTVKGAEKFDEERQREMTSNPQAKEWEESRKRSIQSQKHDYSVKEKQKEAQEFKNIVEELKKGGEFDEDLVPCLGFILVKPEIKEKETHTGIKLPDELFPDPNVGVVIATGGQDIEVGTKILFKKGAGLDVVIKGELLKLMRCVEDVNLTDVLGIFK